MFLPVNLLAEIDYLLNRRLGNDAAFEFIEAVEQGEFSLVALSTADFVHAARSSPSTALWKLGWRTPRSSRHAQPERLQIARLLSQDQRHFQAIQPGLDHFILLPADRE